MHGFSHKRQQRNPSDQMPHPVLMEGPRLSNGTRSRPRRKPLADLTNSSTLRLSTAVKSLKPRTILKESPEHSSTKSYDSSAGSSDPQNPGDRESPRSTVVAEGISSTVAGVVSGRKGTTSKRVGQSTFNLEYVKEKYEDISFTAGFSCPPERTKKHRNDSVEYSMNLNVACSEPCQKKKKRQRCLGSSESSFVDDIPLQDFIQKQKAYFAEVDSFELHEELVSESELE